MAMSYVLIWWKRRTILERSLLFALLVGTFLFAVFAIISQKVLVTSQKLASEKFCLSPECIHLASEIMEDMDTKVNPCEDFYRFACGGFLRNTLIHDQYTHVGNFDFVSKKLYRDLKTVIEKNITANEPKTFKLVKNYYKSCMDEHRIESLGLNPYKNVLNELGGWPVLLGNAWKSSKFTWTKIMYKFREKGFWSSCFFSMDIDYDFKQTSKLVVNFDQASLGIHRVYLIKGHNDSNVKAYYDHMLNVAVRLGANMSIAIKELKKSLDFEIQLAKITRPTEERRNISSLYNPMELNDVVEKFPKIPWLEYINKFVHPYALFTSEDVVVINAPHYLSKLEKLLDSTPKRVLANYAMWRLIDTTVPYLTKDVRQSRANFIKLVNGNSEPERWKDCIRVVGKNLMIGVSALYVRTYVNDKVKSQVIDMVLNMRKEFRKMLEKLTWMDEETKKNALEKADAMTSYVAYPSELFDNKKLDELYKDLEINPTNYLENMWNVMRYNSDSDVRLLKFPIDKTSWRRHARSIIVNAFYSPIENSIQFPAGILQGMFFNDKRPKYMNFGAIGTVISHEITHGFDDQGGQFDKYGNLINWWQPETQKKFLDKAQCIIQQYGNYTVKEIGLKINGLNTQGENIADIGAAKIVYYTYKEWVKKRGGEYRLPGLNYTNQQMLWISMANTWCNKARPEVLRQKVLTGVHSPSEFRVIGPLSNSVEFAKDFKCPIGSKMNPRKKCIIW